MKTTAQAIEAAAERAEAESRQAQEAAAAGDTPKATTHAHRADEAAREARRTAEASPEAREARKAARANPDAPGRFTRGGDRRGSRAAERVGAANLDRKRAAKAAKAAWRAVTEAVKAANINQTKEG